VKTSLIKLRLVNCIAQLRTLTEIELYGPLSGREGALGFEDAEGENTYMGSFSRVDTRTKRLADSYQRPLVVSHHRGGQDGTQWFAPLSHVLVSADRIHVGRAFGQNTGHAFDKPGEDVYSVRTGGLGFTPHGTLYGGLLLRCGNDGKLYCFNPETGTEVWSVKLGERLLGCPVAVGDDLFLANDAGELFQLDLASGSILKETALSGTVQGSLATDGKHLLLISEDGFLQDYAATGLTPLWKTAVAPATDSTPAVDGGVVYLADQQGVARAVAVADGKVLWQTPLGDEFCRCPVVTREKVVFGCRGGTLAVLSRAEGKLLWSKKVESRFEYEPLVLEDKLLFFRGRQLVLAELADGREKPWEISDPANPAAPSEPVRLQEYPAMPISYYRGNLFFVGRGGDTWHDRLQVNMPWHPGGGSLTVLRPTPPPKEKEKP
jgi:outer membrane protein assembly factor BamB